MPVSYTIHINTRRKKNDLYSYVLICHLHEKKRQLNAEYETQVVIILYKNKKKKTSTPKEICLLRLFGRFTSKCVKRQKSSLVL